MRAVNDVSQTLAAVLSELMRREPIFHRPEFGTARADFERMTVEDFWEIGASGSIYERAFVLDELEKRRSTPQNETWKPQRSAFEKSRPIPICCITTCCKASGRRRTTVWKCTEDGWKSSFTRARSSGDDTAHGADSNVTIVV